jgi:hypothetical protein
MTRRLNRRWAPDPETAQRWRAVLASMTTDAIRETLNRYDTVGLQAEISIGPVPMTKGLLCRLPRLA